MGRGSFVYVGAIMIMGLFAFSYMLMSPFWDVILTVSDQVAAWNIETHNLFGIIWNVLPVAVVCGVILYVLAESNPPE